MATKKPPKKRKPKIQRRSGFFDLKIGKETWTIVVIPHAISEVYGYANKDLKLIILDGTLSEEAFLDVLLHEVGHALEWKATERAVRKRATEFARILTQLGYKR